MRDNRELDETAAAVEGNIDAIGNVRDELGDAYKAAVSSLWQWCAILGWVALAFVGILLDSRGMMDVKVLGLPITLSKLMVMYAVGTHFVHALMGKSPLMRWSR